MKLPRILLLVCAALVAVVILFYAKSSHINTAEHERFTTQLSRLNQLDATLSADLLKVRFHLLENYDTFPQQIEEVKRILGDLAQAPSFVPPAARESIRAKVDELVRLFELKAELLEDFKSQNAVLNNSVRYFPVVAAEVLSTARDHELEVHAGALARQVLTYSLNSNDELVPGIRASLARIAAAKESDGAKGLPLASLMAHADSILRRQPKVDDLARQLTSVPTGQRAEELHRLYETQFALAMQNANHQRQVLNGLCLLLVIGIAATIFALDKANRNLDRRVRERTGDLSRANEGLRVEIAERRRAEEALRTKQAQMEALQDASPLGMFFSAADGTCLYTNRTFERITGASQEQIRGSAWRNVIHPDDRARVIDEWAQATAAGRNYETILRYLRPDQSVVWASVKAAVVKQDGVVTGYVGTADDITERRLAEEKLEAAHRQLVDASRRAGMAEVATGVLHNVGNVLNSVNVSASVIAEGAKKSKVSGLTKATALLQEHAGDMGAFLANDPKGRKLPGYLQQLSEHLEEEQAAILKEVAVLAKNIDHIKDIVSMQQSYAKVSGLVEVLPVTELVEDALRMNATALSRHDVQVTREYGDIPPLPMDKHKVLQILVNLIRNAKHACDDAGRSDKQLIVRVAKNGNGCVKIAVSDNGVGIPPENLIRIFSHGFTTRKDGHGFGLHSGALAAKEMGGSLSVHSDGPGLGATFTLELPITPQAQN
ncbi:MAG: DAHL domain-containing protein [Verrucomicrobiota bacterium]